MKTIKSRGCSFLVMLGMLFLAGACAPTQHNYTITPPDAGVGSERAAFLGQWGGFFTGKDGGTRDIEMFVTKVGMEDATVEYIYGDYMKGPRKDGSSGRQTFRGVFSENGKVLTIKFGSGSTESFELNPNGTIMRAKFFGNQISEANLHRIGENVAAN